MRKRSEIENGMKEFIKENPMPNEIAFYHRVITEIFLDIRELVHEIGFMVQGLTKKT